MELSPERACYCLTTLILCNCTMTTCIIENYSVIHIIANIVPPPLDLQHWMYYITFFHVLVMPVLRSKMWGNETIPNNFCVLGFQKCYYQATLPDKANLLRNTCCICLLPYLTA